MGVAILILLELTLQYNEVEDMDQPAIVAILILLELTLQYMVGLSLELEI